MLFFGHEEDIARSIHESMDEYTFRWCLFIAGDLHDVGSIFYASRSIFHAVSLAHHGDKCQVKALNKCFYVYIRR